MPVPFHRVYLESAGYFMPGEPIPNERMDAYIAPLNRMSERIKRRVDGLAQGVLDRQKWRLHCGGGRRGIAGGRRPWDAALGAKPARRFDLARAAKVGVLDF